MKIFVSGGLGFIGRHVVAALLEKGHHVTATGTKRGPGALTHKRFRYIPADTSREGEWSETVHHADVVINLAGKTIFKRWTRRHKQQILDSRVRTTKNIVAALPDDRETLLLSASATGYYGNRGDLPLDETAPNGGDFLANVGRAWESAAFTAEKKGARVVTARFGVVLGAGGGALKTMIPVYRSFVGGPIGNGRQWFPWIHVTDLVSALLFAMEKKTVSGPVNFCAPTPVRNRELAKILGKALNRPASMPVPAFVIRLAMGELADALLSSQRAVPGKLLDYGFPFKYPRINEAVEQILTSSST